MTHREWLLGLAAWYDGLPYEAGKKAARLLRDLAGC